MSQTRSRAGSFSSPAGIRICRPLQGLVIERSPCSWGYGRPLAVVTHRHQRVADGRRSPASATFRCRRRVHAPGYGPVAPSALGRMLAHTSADVIPSERSESRDLWNAKPALTHLSTDPSTRCLWHLPRDDIAEGRFPRNERWDSPAHQEPIAQGRDISRPYTSQANSFQEFGIV